MRHQIDTDQMNPLDNMLIKLNELPIGYSSTIYELTNYGSIRRRLLDLGFIQGTKITPLQTGPSGDPIAFDIKGIVIALRSEDASKIFVTRGNKSKP